jgi:hypothetical protein
MFQGMKAYLERGTVGKRFRCLEEEQTEKPRQYSDILPFYNKQEQKFLVREERLLFLYGSLLY